MVGKRFGRLVALERDGISKDGKAMWKFRCDCGQIVTLNGKLVRSGNTSSCGCLTHERSRRFKDITGQRFGSRVVIKYVDNNTPKRRVSRFLCRCDCGKEKILTAPEIEKSKSCGCQTIRFIMETHITHGQTSGGRTKEYRAWKSMKERCLRENNKGYHNYGGRGITVCERWLTFENFLADVGRAPDKCLEVERRNNNGNYEPGNIYWATAKEQARNRRTNVYATHEGVKLCALDWSIKLGMKYWTVLRKIKANWTIARIIQHYKPDGRPTRQNHPLQLPLPADLR